MTRLLLLLLLLAARPVAAQDIHACDAPREGAVACLSGKLCLCRFVPGGQMTARPDGHRWDCGALRPACGEALAPPGQLFLHQPLPPLMLDLPIRR